MKWRALKILAFLLLLGFQQSCRPSEQTPPPQQPSAPELPLALPPKVQAPQIERLLPESQLRAPQQDRASIGLKYDTRTFQRTLGDGNHPGWQYRSNRQNQIVGFDFSNHGGNRILPQRYDIGKNQLFGRDFQFRFDELARQDIHLLISDWAPSRDKQFRLSELMNSVMLFFPRKYLPAIANSAVKTLVTLSTGEDVEFDAMTNEIVGGVLAEEPVDLNPDRAARKFPGISYTGKGIVVRADARGSDPRLSALASITTGSPPADCANGSNCNQCKVPTQDLWHTSGAVRFKFATDDEFGRFLLSRCNFAMPRTETKN
jgi:hypothetical protein